MKVLVFDLRAPLAHFRRPDSTATHPTYPFITGTVLRGLLGAVLGLEEFTGRAWAGVQLLNPVRTRAQELSMLGKGFFGNGPAFNRPTSVELVIKPHYRIFYTGDYLDELAERIRQQRSTFPTYLGSAYALCVPLFKELFDARETKPEKGTVLESLTAVPVHVIEELVISPGNEYARASGLPERHIGGRRFRGTVNLVYEQKGNPVAFVPKIPAPEPPVYYLSLPAGGVVTLW